MSGFAPIEHGPGFALLSGCPDPRNPSSDELAMLIDESANFLRSGGVVSMAEWRAITPVERAALIEAGTIVACERASLAGFAAQGGAQAVAVGSRADGGEMARNVALRAVLSSVASKASGAAFPIPTEAP